MKFVMMILAAMVSFGASAVEVPSVITGTAEDIVCGEMDPFAVGDACIVYTTDEATGMKLGLVYDDYDWAIVHVPETDSVGDLVGDRFEASTCEKIYDRDQISVLKDFNSEYFYVNCYTYDFNWLYGEE